MPITVYTPQNDIKCKPVKVFLAGSIDNGNAEEWQKTTIKYLKSIPRLAEIDIEVYNPRRDDWDTLADPTTSSVYLQEQILWELDTLKKADIVAMYLTKDSKAPISMLELGKYANSQTILYCPTEFYRSTNVYTFCDYYNIPCHSTTDSWKRRLVDGIIFKHLQLRRT